MKNILLAAILLTGSASAQVQIGKGVQIGGAGTGTGSVTSVSVTTANGFQGTVSSPSTTPGIQINVDSTHCLPVNTGTGLDFLAGNCTYLPPFTLTTTGTSGAATFSGGVLNIPQYTGGSGSVTTVSVTTANGVSGTVANPTTTPAISLTLGAITPSSVASTGQVSGTSLVSGTPSAGALAALPTGAHGMACDESSTSGIPWAGGDYIRCKTGVGLVQSVNGGAEAPIGGASGFPITIGSTSVAASSTTTALAGLALTTSSINGVTPSTTAGSGNFLNGAGGYSSPGGISVKIKYVSVEGCPQDTDLTAGGGTDATTCINGLFVGASPTNPILVVQDGASLLSGFGVQMPAGGGAFLQGSGGGISQVAVTNCSLTSNVATFTTEPQAPLITVGQYVQLAALSTCSALNGAVVQALSSGLTSTQFKANFTHADIASGAETATGKTVYGTGFYLASGSGDAISNGRVPSAGNCEIVAGTPPSRGAGLGISNLVINGNAAAQTDYCFLVDFDNADNIFVDNVTLYNAVHYGVHMGNVGQVKITRSSFIAAQAYTGAMVTTDGIHMTGPWNDLTISNDYFNTGDDAIALNASEGYCGPGDRTEITNSTSYSSLRMLRVYNDGAVCGNGLTPLIDTVNISNYSGSAYDSVAFLGFGTIGTLNPAITNFTWANSVVKATTSGLSGIHVTNNIGRLSLDDFTMEGFGGCLLCSEVGSQSIALLKLHNVSLVGNSFSSGFIVPLGAVAGGGTLTATDAIVDGLGEYNDTGGTISADCPFCSGAVTNLYASNIDMNLFNTFADSHVTNLEGQAGENAWLVPRGGANGQSTVNLKNGIIFRPTVSAGGAHTWFEDTSGSHNVYADFDNNNRTLTIDSGAASSIPLTITSTDTGGTVFQITNASSGSHSYSFFSNGSSRRPEFAFFDSTAGAEMPAMGLTGSTPYFQVPTLGVLGFATGAAYNSVPDTGFSRDSANVVDVGNGTAGDKSGTVNAANYVLPSAGTVKFGSSDVVLSDNGSGTLQVGHTGANSGGGISAFSLSLNQCISNAVPALCGGSTTGTVAVPAGGTTLVVDTTSVTSTGQIQLTFDSSLGAALGVTCNTAINQPTVSARTAGTSFTITMSGSITTNPDCVSYTIIN